MATWWMDYRASHRENRLATGSLRRVREWLKGLEWQHTAYGDSGFTLSDPTPDPCAPKQTRKVKLSDYLITHMRGMWV